MNDTNTLSDICLCGSSHADDPDRARIAGYLGPIAHASEPSVGIALT